MTGGYSVRFPLASHLERFEIVLKDNPAAPLIRAAIDALAANPRPKDKGFEEIPPVEEAMFLISQFGVAVKTEEFPGLHYRAMARCRIKVGAYWILYDIMDDLKMVWLFQVVKEQL